MDNFCIIHSAIFHKKQELSILILILRLLFLHSPLTEDKKHFPFSPSALSEKALITLHHYRAFASANSHTVMCCLFTLTDGYHIYLYFCSFIVLCRLWQYIWSSRENEKVDVFICVSLFQPVLLSGFLLEGLYSLFLTR